MAYNVTSAGTNVTYLIRENCVSVSLSRTSPLDHPDDIVTFATQQRFKEICDVYILSPLVLLSVPSNIVNMIVFWRHGIKERINLCLFFLSLADIIVMVIHFEIKLDRVYATITNTPYTMVVTKFSINNMIHTGIGFVYISQFMSTVIAIERCMCVVFPLKARNMLQTRTTAIIIALGHALIFGAFCVNASRWKVTCLYNPLTETSVDAYYASEFYLSNKDLLDIFDGAIFGIFLPGVFVTGVAVCTTITVVKLRQMKNWRQKSTSARFPDGYATKDVTVTRMLIGTSVLFVICSTPPLAIHVVRPFIPEMSLHGKLYNTFFFLTTMQQPFFYVNSSVNFFVYYSFGTKFRTTVRHMFCGGCHRGEENTSTLQVSVAISSVRKVPGAKTQMEEQ
ncbi:hypothetical protein ACOMHN_058073 [Nucella lapillus]